jgi:hypothetical protein
MAARIRHRKPGCAAGAPVFLDDENGIDRPGDAARAEEETRSAVAIAAAAEAAALAAASTPAAAPTTASLRFVDANRPPFQIPAVELLDGGVCGFIRPHLDEAESARSIGGAVDDNLRALNLACLGEDLLQILIAYTPSQISNVQSAAH